MQLTCYTSHSSILRVRTVRDNTVIRAVNQSGFIYSTSNIIQSYDDITVLPKVCIGVGSWVCVEKKCQKSLQKLQSCSLHTGARVSKLSTSNIRIHCGPVIMTHGPPVSIQTHFHPTLHTIGTTSQSDIARSTFCNIGKTGESWLLYILHIFVYATHVLHIALQHHQSENSQRQHCHKGSQSVWIHIQYKQHYPELWWYHCFAQSVHWSRQLSLCGKEMPKITAKIAKLLLTYRSQSIQAVDKQH